jgi:hypothetical protein
MCLWGWLLPERACEVGSCQSVHRSCRKQRHPQAWRQAPDRHTMTRHQHPSPGSFGHEGQDVISRVTWPSVRGRTATFHNRCAVSGCYNCCSLLNSAGKFSVCNVAEGVLALCLHHPAAGRRTPAELLQSPGHSRGLAGTQTAW